MSLTSLAFLGAYALALALALFRHPRYALYAYMGIFYLDPPSRWWGAMLPSFRWSLVTAVVMLLTTLLLKAPKGDELRTPPWYTTTPARLLICMSLWIWFQNLWALAPEEHLELSVLYTKYVLLYAVMYRLMEKPSDFTDVMFVHVLGCGYLGWLVLQAPSGGRLEGVGGPGIDEANALGMFVSTGALCGAMLILVQRGWRQWLAILLMPLILNALVQSESRGAMLGLVVGGLVLFALKPRRYAKIFYAFAAFGVLLFSHVAHDAFWERMGTLDAAVQEEEELDSSAESRVVLAEAQLRMAAAYPLGAGHRGTAVLSPDYLEEKWLTRSTRDGPAARSSHNTFLSALVEQGLPGAILYALFGVWGLRQYLALRRANRAGSADAFVLMCAPAFIAALAAVGVAGQFTDYLKTEVQMWMFALLAAAMGMLRVEAESRARRAAAGPDAVSAQQGAPPRAGTSRLEARR